MVARGSLWEHPWAPKTTPKRIKYQYLAQVVCTPISEGLLARIVAETGSELHDGNSVWTAPARTDRMLAVLRKKLPEHTFFNILTLFWVTHRAT